MTNQVDVQRLIDEAIAKGGGEVKLPEGTYRLDRPLRIGDAKDVTLDGCGSTLVFTERRGRHSNREIAPMRAAKPGRGLRPGSLHPGRGDRHASGG